LVIESNSQSMGSSIPLDEISRSKCIEVVSLYYDVLDVRSYEWGVELLLGEARRGYNEDARINLYSELINGGCKPIMRPTGEGLILRLVIDRGGGSAILRGSLLAAATLVTVYLSGEWLANSPGPRGVGFPWTPYGYLLGLLVPLIIHELGHWSIMKMYRVPSSIPYLIPAPPLQLGFLGTLGAVINLRWLPPTSGSLALMAVMGPLAGFLAAIPFTIVGIHSSIVASPQQLPEGSVGIQIVPAAFILFTNWFAPSGSGEVILLSPMAYASYVVLLVTFLNLMPVAMLDGGHIIRSAVNEGVHRLISQATIAILIAASFIYPSFLMFAILAMIIYFLSRGRHPGPAMGEGDLGRTGVLSIVIYGVLLALTAPIPV